MVGTTLREQGVRRNLPPYISVKEAVFPFIKFPGVDTILGPEMRSTGEVMGVGESFGEAFVKSQLAAGVKLAESGRAFISVKNADKPKVIEIAKMLAAWASSSSRRGEPRRADPRPACRWRPSTRSPKGGRTSST